MGRMLLLLVSVFGCGCAASSSLAHEAPSKDHLRLRRTECLGTCPVYVVTLYLDGTVVYDGERFAPRGRRVRRIEPGRVEELMDAFEKIREWTCDGLRLATDYPESIVSLRRDGRARMIRHYHGDPCTPTSIRQLEAQIDRAGGHPHFVDHVKTDDQI